MTGWDTMAGAERDAAMPLRDTLRQLEYFVAVGETGSIAAASQQVNVSSPSISAGISQLEEELGVKLFVRYHAQGLTPTLAVRKLLDHAQIMLPGLRRSFIEDYAEVRISQVEADQAELFGLLRQARIDLALTYDLDLPTDLRFFPILELPPLVAMGESHPLAQLAEVSIEQLAPLPMVLLDLPFSADYFLSFFVKQGLRANIAERTRDMSVMRSLVANGFGYSIVNVRPLRDIAPDGRPMRFVPLAGQPRPMRLGVLVSDGTERTQLHKTFIQHARAWITANCARLLGGRCRLGPRLRSTKGRGHAEARTEWGRQMSDRQAWLFRAAQLFAAAALALMLAVALGLQSPYWAAMPVWVVAQPHRQDLLLRAVLRLLGTGVGAAVGWAALVWLGYPWAVVTVLLLSLGLGTVLTYWIGGVYSYGVLLAAITVAVVLIPALDHPVDATALALDRIACTVIGVLAVTAITFLFTPRRQQPPPPLPPARLRTVPLHALLVMAASGLGCLAMLALGGAPGIAAAMALSIFSLLLGSSRQPQPLLRYLPAGAAIGVVAAVGYRALDQALPDHTLGLTVVLALAFVAAGALLRAHPRTAPFGLDANMCFLLAAEAGTTGHDLRAHAMAGVALVAGAGLLVALFRRLGAADAADAG
ncbi:FUSC family protein [Paracoccus sp. SMMA_5]